MGRVGHGVAPLAALGVQRRDVEHEVRPRDALAHLLRHLVAVLAEGVAHAARLGGRGRSQWRGRKRGENDKKIGFSGK